MAAEFVRRGIKMHDAAKETHHCLLQQSEANLTLTAGRNLLNLSYSLLIWNANSLVWHITSTETCTES